MVDFNRDWKRIRLQKDHQDDGSILVSAAEKSPGSTKWTVELDATKGRGDLFSYSEKPVFIHDIALIQTFGEHYRGATSHNFKCHAISQEGELLWVHPWHLECAPVPLKDDLFFLVRLNTSRVPDDGHLFDLVVVDTKSGRVRKTRGVELPRRTGYVI